MKFAAILGLVILMTPNVAAKHRKLYAIFPANCHPKAKLVGMSCQAVGEMTWRCSGGHVDVVAGCIQYVSEEDK